jgi:peroxiredoxin
MRVQLCWAWALAVALGPTARADEPAKPTATASEANPAVPAPGHSIHGEAFNEGPRQEAKRLDGMGKVAFAVTTARPEAQAFISQGVAQLHTFYYLEAERSFRQAARLDPDCPMAYWGMAMSNVNNPRRAKGFFQEARKRAEKVKLTPRERLYLDAMAALYKDGVDDKERRQGHLKGYEAIVQDFPSDLDARAWLAMITWQNSGRDGIGSRQAVDSLIDEVLRAEPMHPGAHHYRIHLWDGAKPDRALASAALYGKAAPGIAHAWHMPGHTYTGLKRYADAAYQQEASARVDHAAMARDRIMPFEIFNYAHNNQWLCTSLSHVGRARDAIAVARNLVEEPRDPQKNGPNDGGSSQREGRARWSEVLVRFELWDDLIAANASGALDWSDIPLERKQKAYTLGLAYAAKEDRAKLAEQVAALKALADAKAKGGPAPGAAAALAELEGYQKLLDGDVGAAFDLFAKATGMRPEALARAHLKARNYGFAESVAKKAAADHPNEVPPLACYVEVLHAVGKDKEAQAAYRKLDPLARAADRDTPVFRRLAALVAAWEAGGERFARTPEPETDDAAMNRIDLATLGPLTWSPYAAEPFALADTTGATWSLADHRGKDVLVLFYLGGKCAHCMQQLQEFGKAFADLKAPGTEVVAVGTDDAEATRALKANADGVKFPMPLLADPGLSAFKAYRAFDDFEGRPLHGTFLIDAEGKVRFQRISYDPFLDVDFIKSEAARVKRLARP